MKLHFQHTQTHTKTTKRRILIVEDEPDVNLAVKVTLEDRGCDVDTFNHPMLALCILN
jgi:DNA-binding response OmpR family regulator